jgi:hypothetical protein
MVGVIALVTHTAGCAAQSAGDRELASMLANDGTRAAAVTQILASGTNKVPVLLSWTSTTPAQVDKYGLSVGLADVFGGLKTKEAIPFLIKNISRRRVRYVYLAPWLKTDQVILNTFPALAALIQIGPAASRALIRAASGPMSPEDRSAAVFAVSRIAGVPEARDFLAQALGESNLEGRFAEEGLERLGENH